MTPDHVTRGSHAKVWWQCSVNSAHEWESAVNNRVSGNGCPFCRLVGKSRDEIILAHELLEFFDFDPNEDTVAAGGQLRKVDTLIPGERLIVEFDGSRWHRDKAAVDRDRKKTADLMQIGWRVIRAREEPLNVLGPCDVVVPRGDHKLVADRVLQKIEEVLRVRIGGLKEYLDQDSLTNIDQAEAFIADILKRQAECGAKGNRRQ